MHRSRPPVLRGWLDRLLGVVGLDFDLPIELGRDAFNRITPDLFLGGRPEPSLLPALQEAGISHVFSCLPAGDQDRVAFLEAHVETGFLAMHDGMHEDLASSFSLFFDFVAEAHASHPDPRVLVHCERGVSRSATLAIALHMHRTHQRFFESFTQVRAKRPEVLPNIGFATQLQRFEAAMHPSAPAESQPSSLGRYLLEVCRVPVDLDVIEQALQRHDHDALPAIRSIFGNDVPRVVQGVRA